MSTEDTENQRVSTAYYNPDAMSEAVAAIAGIVGLIGFALMSAIALEKWQPDTTPTLFIVCVIGIAVTITTHWVVNVRTKGKTQDLQKGFSENAGPGYVDPTDVDMHHYLAHSLKKAAAHVHRYAFRSMCLLLVAAILCLSTNAKPVPATAVFSNMLILVLMSVASGSLAVPFIVYFTRSIARLLYMCVKSRATLTAAVGSTSKTVAMVIQIILFVFTASLGVTAVAVVVGQTTVENNMTWQAGFGVTIAVVVILWLVAELYANTASNAKAGTDAEGATTVNESSEKSNHAQIQHLHAVSKSCAEMLFAACLGLAILVELPSDFSEATHSMPYLIFVALFSILLIEMFCKQLAMVYTYFTNTNPGAFHADAFKKALDSSTLRVVAVVPTANRSESNDQVQPSVLRTINGVLFVVAGTAFIATWMSAMGWTPMEDTGSYEVISIWWTLAGLTFLLSIILETMGKQEATTLESDHVRNTTITHLFTLQVTFIVAWFAASKHDSDSSRLTWDIQDVFAHTLAAYSTSAVVLDALTTAIMKTR